MKRHGPGHRDRGDEMDERTPAGDNAPAEVEPPEGGAAPPGQAARPPGGGPARDGGSGLTADEEPAEEGIGGGD